MEKPHVLNQNTAAVATDAKEYDRTTIKTTNTIVTDTNNGDPILTQIKPLSAEGERPSIERGLNACGTVSVNDDINNYGNIQRRLTQQQDNAIHSCEVHLVDQHLHQKQQQKQQQQQDHRKKEHEVQQQQQQQHQNQNQNQDDEDVVTELQHHRKKIPSKLKKAKGKGISGSGGKVGAIDAKVNRSTRSARSGSESITSFTSSSTSGRSTKSGGESITSSNSNSSNSSSNKKQHMQEEITTTDKKLLKVEKVVETPEYNKEATEQRKRKRVIFAEAIDVLEIIHVSDIPSDVSEQLWWSRSEFRKLKKEQDQLCTKVISLMSTHGSSGSTSTEGLSIFQNDSIRGLEPRFGNYGKIMLDIICNAKRAVFNEQDLQIMLMMNNDSKNNLFEDGDHNDDNAQRQGTDSRIGDTSKTTDQNNCENKTNTGCYYNFDDIREVYVRETRNAALLALRNAEKDAQAVQQYYTTPPDVVLSQATSAVREVTASFHQCNATSEQTTISSTSSGSHINDDIGHNSDHNNDHNTAISSPTPSWRRSSRRHSTCGSSMANSEIDASSDSLPTYHEKEADFNIDTKKTNRTNIPFQEPERVEQEDEVIPFSSTATRVRGRVPSNVTPTDVRTGITFPKSQRRNSTGSNSWDDATVSSRKSRSKKKENNNNANNESRSTRHKNGVVEDNTLTNNIHAAIKVLSHDRVDKQMTGDHSKDSTNSLSSCGTSSSMGSSTKRDDAEQTEHKPQSRRHPRQERSKATRNGASNVKKKLSRETDVNTDSITSESTNKSADEKIINQSIAGNQGFSSSEQDHTILLELFEGEGVTGAVLSPTGNTKSALTVVTSDDDNDQASRSIRRRRSISPMKRSGNRSVGSSKSTKSSSVSITDTLNSTLGVALDNQKNIVGANNGQIDNALDAQNNRITNGLDRRQTNGIKKIKKSTAGPCNLTATNSGNTSPNPELLDEAASEKNSINIDKKSTNMVDFVGDAITNFIDDAMRNGAMHSDVNNGNSSLEYPYSRSSRRRSSSLHDIDVHSQNVNSANFNDGTNQGSFFTATTCTDTESLSNTNNCDVTDPVKRSSEINISILSLPTATSSFQAKQVYHENTSPEYIENEANNSNTKSHSPSTNSNSQTLVGRFLNRSSSLIIRSPPKAILDAGPPKKSVRRLVSMDSGTINSPNSSTKGTLKKQGSRRLSVDSAPTSATSTGTDVSSSFDRPVLLAGDSFSRRQNKVPHPMLVRQRSLEYDGVKHRFQATPSIYDNHEIPRQHDLSHPLYLCDDCDWSLNGSVASISSPVDPFKATVSFVDSQFEDFPLLVPPIAVEDSDDQLFMPKSTTRSTKDVRNSKVRIPRRSSTGSAPVTSFNAAIPVGDDDNDPTTQSPSKRIATGVRKLMRRLSTTSKTASESTQHGDTFHIS